MYWIYQNSHPWKPGGIDSTPKAPCPQWLLAKEDFKSFAISFSEPGVSSSPSWLHHTDSKGMVWCRNPPVGPVQTLLAPMTQRHPGGYPDCWGLPESVIKSLSPPSAWWHQVEMVRVWEARGRQAGSTIEPELCSACSERRAGRVRLAQQRKKFKHPPRPAAAEWVRWEAEGGGGGVGSRLAAEGA